MKFSSLYRKYFRLGYIGSLSIKKLLIVLSSFCVGLFLFGGYLSANGSTQDDTIIWYKNASGSLRVQDYSFFLGYNDSYNPTATYQLTSPVSGFSLAINGNFTGDISLPIGQYHLEYERCFSPYQQFESSYYIFARVYADDITCETARIDVSVSPSLGAASDDFGAIPLSSSGIKFVSPQSVLDNDTYLGSPVASDNVLSISLIRSSLTGVVLGNDGRVTFPHGASSGVYSAEYELCYLEPDESTLFLSRFIGVAYAGAEICAKGEITFELQSPILRQEVYQNSAFFEVMAFYALINNNVGFDLPDIGPQNIWGYAQPSEVVLDLVSSDAPVYLSEPSSSADLLIDTSLLNSQNRSIRSTIRSCVSYENSQTIYCESYSVRHEIMRALLPRHFTLEVTVGEVLTPQESYSVDPTIANEWNASPIITEQLEIISSDLPNSVFVDGSKIAFRSEASQIPGIYNFEYRTCAFATLPADDPGIIEDQSSFFESIIPSAIAQSPSLGSPIGCVTSRGQLTVRDTQPISASRGGSSGGGNSHFIQATPITSSLSSSQNGDNVPALSSKEALTPSISDNGEKKSPPTLDQCTSFVRNLDDRTLQGDAIKYARIMESQRNQPLTRSQFFSLFAQSSGLSGTGSHNYRFTDVEKNNKLFPYIQALVQEGYLRDVAQFRPSAIMSRAEAARIFVIANKKGLFQYSQSSFSDVIMGGTPSAYIESAYQQCLLHGRMTRDGESLLVGERIFEPLDGITLAETVKVLKNIYSEKSKK